MKRDLLLCFIVLLAGCSGSTTTVTPTPTPSPVATHSDTPTATPTPIPTSTPTPYLSPYHEQTLTVSIAVPSDPPERYQTVVEKAVRYWSFDGKSYLPYPADLEYVPGVENPDIIVKFVDSVGPCADTKEPIGCADYVPQNATAPTPVIVRIQRGYTNTSLRETLKHELGHAVGLHHNDAPQTVMEPYQNTTSLPRPNVSERLVPWESSTLNVYIDVSDYGIEGKRKARTQISHALSYWEEGAKGQYDGNISLNTVSNRSSADITIVASQRDLCDFAGPDGGSCSIPLGYDYDADESLEVYSNYTVKVGSIPKDKIGWHVGYQLSGAFALTGDDLPDEFDGRHTDRDGEWWE